MFQTEKTLAPRHPSAGEVTVVTMVKDSRAASILVPVLPERGERQWRSVLKRQKEGLFSVLGPSTFEPPVCRNHAPT